MVNLQQSHIEISHHISLLTVSLHYFVKYECQKTGGNLKYVLRLQGSIAKHLSCDGLLDFITDMSFHLLLKIFLNVREHLAKLQAKWLIVSYTAFALRRLSTKMQNSPDKLNNLCITDKNCY